MTARRGRAYAALATLVTVALLAIATRAATADDLADDARAARFDAAMAAVSSAPARAVDELIALAADAPAAPIAADALLLAARTAEDRLHDPVRALALYEQLGRRYPDARASKAASRRAEALRALVGDDGQHAAAATAFGELRAMAGQRLTTAERTTAEALADAAWPGAIDAALWLADVDARDGRVTQARTRLAALMVRTAGTPRDGDVVRAAASLAIRAGAIAEAEQLIARLPAAPSGAGAADAVVASELRAALAHARTRQRVVHVALLVALVGVLLLVALLVSAAGSLRHVGRALRPPIDVWYIAPVLAVLVLAAATGFVGIGRAVALIAGANINMTWLSGAGLGAAAARGRSTPRVLAHALLAPMVVLAVATAVLASGDLADLVLATLRDGPDR